jgi:hypothetical protein
MLVEKQKKGRVSVVLLIKKSLYDELHLWCESYEKTEDEFVSALLSIFCESEKNKDDDQKKAA